MIGYGCCRFCGDSLPWSDDIPDVCLRCDDEMRRAVEEDDAAIEDELRAEQAEHEKMRDYHDGLRGIEA